jgi:hypothetical protein
VDNVHNSSQIICTQLSLCLLVLVYLSLLDDSRLSMHFARQRTCLQVAKFYLVWYNKDTAATNKRKFTATNDI